MDDISPADFLIIEGGTATELIRMGRTDINDDPLWSSKLLQSDPDGAIKTVYRRFLEAGSDVIEANTYQANVDHLCKCLGVTEEEAVMLLKKGVEVAMETRDEFWDEVAKDEIESRKCHERRKPLVASSVGPYGACLMDGSEYTGNYIDNVTEEFLINWHRPRIKALIDAGVDVVAMETIPAMAEAVALVKLMREFPSTKAWLSFSCKENGLTRRGECVSTIIDYVLSSDQIVAVGCNCTAPSDVEAVLGKLQRLRGKKAFVVYANSGEKYSKEKGWYWEEECKPLHEYVSQWVQLGATWIGGCCRVYPEDIRKIKDTVCCQNLSISGANAGLALV